MGMATGTPPGSGLAAAFAAGWDELTNAPRSFFEDAVPGVQGSYTPVTPPTPAPIVSAIAAGASELGTDPGQFVADGVAVVKDKLNNAGILPDGKTLTTWLIVGVVGLVAAAYIAHKAL